MGGRLLKSLSANSSQLIVNQALGFGIFYLLSVHLDKNGFGGINFVLAILLAAFNILSCGIDQLVVKKIASGGSIPAVVSMFSAHVLISGLLFYAGLLAAYFLLPRQAGVCYLLLLVGMGKLLVYFSLPFKQAMNGAERFTVLGVMSVVSNLVRFVCLVTLSLIGHLDLFSAVIVFICGDAAELIVCVFLYIFNTKIPLTVQWDRRAYLALLKEAVPQSGVVIITSALARLDWIFIGLMVSAAKLADYSFAYKIFEVSSLPLLVVAPILIPRFARMFSNGNVQSIELFFLIRIEMVVAGFTGLLLAVCWTPLADVLAAGKYGSVNQHTIDILSLCLPFLYFNNFFWTIYFVQGRLKMIFVSFLLTFGVNLAGNIVLIPLMHNEGAALAFLLACISQAVYYFTHNTNPKLGRAWQPLLYGIAAMLISVVTVKLVAFSSPAAIALSAGSYSLLLMVTGQLKLKEDGGRLKNMLITR